MYSRTRYGPGIVSRLLYLLGGCMAFSIVFSTTKMLDFLSIEWILGVLGAIAVFIGGGRLGTLFERRRHRTQQAKRDARSALIFQQAIQGEAGKFSLYFRAFETTGQLPYAKTDSVGPIGFEPRFDLNLDLETVLAEAVEWEMPLVALGHPGEQTGAGRILTTDDCWQQDVEILAKSAQFIFVLPSDRLGTKWEIDFISKNKMFDKSIFIMPPLESGFRWEQISKYIDIVSLPPYNENGCMFFIDSEGNMAENVHFSGLMKARYVRLAIKDLIGKRHRPQRGKRISKDEEESMKEAYRKLTGTRI